MHVEMDPLQKQMLDDVFDAFTMLAPGSIVSLMHVGAGVTRYTASAVDLFGFPGEYVPDGAMDFTNWVHPEDRKIYLDAMMPLLEGKAQTYDLNYRIRTVSGEYISFHLVGAVLRDDAGNPSLIGGAMFNEGVTGEIDPVTVMPNKDAFRRRLADYLSAGKGTYSMQVGITGLSEINQLHGYSFGNRILQETGWLVQESVRERGEVFRFEGPSFAILSNTLKRQDMVAIYDHIRYQLQRGVEVNGTNITLSSNGGLISSFSSDADASTICAGLNYAYAESHDHMHGALVDFNGSANYGRVESLEMINALRECATNGCAGFRLEYLPVVSAKDASVLGAEAVVVWESDEFGCVQASDFMPVIERDFVFEEIGDFMLENSLADAVELLKVDPEFLLCINAYRIQLESDYFVENLLYYLNRSGFPASHLSVKFDSDCRNIGMDRMREIIERLQEHEIVVIIGDFGSGTDSIGFLKNEPIDAVSIDGEFAREIDTDERALGVLSHLVDMARMYVDNVNVKGVDSAALRSAISKLAVSTFQVTGSQGSLACDELGEMLMR